MLETSLAQGAPVAAAQRKLELAKGTFKYTAVERGIGFALALLLLFTMHEFAHAYTAWKLGDPTPKEQGRVTLNPLAHLSLFGSIILPAILIWRQSEVLFGWAKPVPFRPENFRDPMRDKRCVAFAGPGTNLVFGMAALLSIVVIAFAVRLISPETEGMNLASPFASLSLAGPAASPYLAHTLWFLRQLVFTSVVLGCFNLLPFPPLDGSWILSSLLPQRAMAAFEKLRALGPIIFLVVIFTPALDIVLGIPLVIAWGLLAIPLGALGFA